MKIPGLVNFRLCKLSDLELSKAVADGLNEMYSTGKLPERHIPAQPDNDFDLLVGELLVRFRELTNKEPEQEKPFPIFWYESNAAFGLCDSIESLRSFAAHQMNEPNSIKSIGDFLDISLIAPRRKPSKHGGIRSFGTRREHTGEQTLKMYLQEHGLLDEFLETWNK